MKLPLLYLLLFCLLLSCAKEQKKEAQGPLNTPAMKTQALLLVQDKAYDNEAKSVVSHDYSKLQSLIVPENLAPQNKWIMFEGPVLENQQIAYRFYGDHRHRSDIYAKSVDKLVMDTVSWDYHKIQNWGSDVLKVGNSLGIGSPAIWYEDSLFSFSNYEDKEIKVDIAGGASAKVSFIFKGLTFGEHSLDVIHEWEIRGKGFHTSNTIRILDGELPEGAYFASGIVKHLKDLHTDTQLDHFLAYTWGKQGFHKKNLGMAVMVENEYQPEQIPDPLSHAFIFKNAPKELTYYFLANWEPGNQGAKNKEAFKEIILASLKEI
ncbi:MAG: DUF4861 family protein [Bacteroidota bacterium]